MGASGYRSNTDGCNDVAAPSKSVLKDASLVLFRMHPGDKLFHLLRRKACLCWHVTRIPMMGACPVFSVMWKLGEHDDSGDKSRTSAGDPVFNRVLVARDRLLYFYLKTAPP